MQREFEEAKVQVKMETQLSPDTRNSGSTASTRREEQLATVIASLVPPLLLQEIVDADGVLPDFDLIIKSAPSEPDARRRHIAIVVARAYAKKNDIGRLARLLLSRLPNNDEFAAHIAAFLREDRDPEGGDEAKEASLALTANFLPYPQLREFLWQTEGRICAIVSKLRVAGGWGFKCGTGFLVGPDLVLTAYHVVKEHIDNGAPIAGCCGSLSACFDFNVGGKITYPSFPVSPAKLVEFHENWLVQSSLDFFDDGRLDADAERVKAAEIRAALDFALVRLAQPVGQQTLTASGGRRRGWVPLMTWPNGLSQDDRIIIPQHPDGLPVCIDFGRFSAQHSGSDKSGTRLRYSTESGPGTSGAPCFTMLDSQFHAVGVHNATFRPNGRSLANQAIDLRSIVPCIQAKLGENAQVNVPSRIWNTGTLDKPQVVLGRDTLLTWIDRACGDITSVRSSRIYGARSLSPKSGASYTLRILQTVLREKRTDLVIELGTEREGIPLTVHDFLRAILYQTGATPDALLSLPPRPASSLPSSGDKLRRWASEEVPRYVNEVLAQQRQSPLDRRELARNAREAMLKANLNIPPELNALADAPAEIKDLLRWSRIWILIDGLQGCALPEEISDLIAGLAGGGASETGMPPELRRLRWLLLGDRQTPSFVDSAEVTWEELDSSFYGRDQMVRALQDFASSIQHPMAELAGGLFEYLVDLGMQRDAAALADPQTRLATMQALFGEIGAKAFNVRRAK